MHTVEYDGPFDDATCDAELSLTFDANAGMFSYSGNCDVEPKSMFTDDLNILPIWRSLISSIAFSRFFSSRSRLWRNLRRWNKSSEEKLIIKGNSKMCLKIYL